MLVSFIFYVRNLVTVKSFILCKFISPPWIFHRMDAGVSISFLHTYMSHSLSTLIITLSLGPLISRDAMMRAKNILARSIDLGASCPLDRCRIFVEENEDFNFLGPTVIELGYSNKLDAFRLLITTNPAYSEEIFGPVLTVFFRTNVRQCHCHYQL